LAMAKFRLAVLNTQPPHLYYGGVERRILEVTRRLQPQADIAVYSGTKAGFKAETNINNVKLVPVKSTDKLFPLDNWTYSRNLTKNSQVFESDIFELHNNSAYGFPAALRKIAPSKPLVHLIHGTLADEYEQGKKGTQSLRGRLANLVMKQQAKQEKAIAQNADVIVTISKYSQAKILEHYGVPEEKIRIVPNGVDIEKFQPSDMAAAKKQFNLGQDSTILFIGSLTPRKGLPYLVEAAKTVVKQQANAKFLLVGSGPLRKQIETSVASAGLSGNFVFYGNMPHNQLATVYNAADVFVLPSLQEGQGIVLLEAQACGKPVIAFGVGGAKEAVKGGESGFLLALGDTEGLADRLLKLLADDALRQKMGAAGRQFVKENYTWDLCAERMLKVYRETLAK
jgi:glycosyltransferase involved in cell wall biosynthesis